MTAGIKPMAAATAVARTVRSDPLPRNTSGVEPATAGLLGCGRMCVCLLRRLGRLPLGRSLALRPRLSTGLPFSGAARDGWWCAGSEPVARAPSTGTNLALRNCAVRTVTRGLPGPWGIWTFRSVSPVRTVLCLYRQDLIITNKGFYQAKCGWPDG